MRTQEHCVEFGVLLSEAQSSSVLLVEYSPLM